MAKARARWRTLIVLGIVSLGLALPSPASAAHAMPGTSMKIVLSYCTPESDSLYWWGMTEDLSSIIPRFRPAGTVSFCMNKYQLLDADPKFDYYAIAIRSEWTLTSGDNWYPAVMNQSVYSNWAARENVYSATSTYTSNTSCNSSFEVSLNIGPFAIAVSPQICSGATVSQISNTPRGAAWGTNRVGKVSAVETLYAQKIPEGGSVPRFDVQFKVPQYTADYNGTVWDYTPAWRNHTFAAW